MREELVMGGWHQKALAGAAVGRVTFGGEAIQPAAGLNPDRDVEESRTAEREAGYLAI